MFLKNNLCKKTGVEYIRLTFSFSVFDSRFSNIISDSDFLSKLISLIEPSSFLELFSDTNGDLVRSIGAEYSFLVKFGNFIGGFKFLSIGAEYSFLIISPALAASEYEYIAGRDQSLILGSITVDLGVTDNDLPLIFLTMLLGI